MPKSQADCEAIYYYEWKDKRTKWLFRLYMIPSYDAYLGSGYNTYKLPDGLIRNMNYDWEFSDGKYVGTPEMPSLNFTLDLSLLDGKTLHPEYNIFAKLCYENTAIIEFENVLDRFNFDIKFVAGNVWYLIVDYTGLGTTWNCLFAGSQEAKSECPINKSENTMEIEVLELGKTLCEKVKSKFLLYFHGKNLTYGDNGKANLRIDYIDNLVESSDNRAIYNHVVFRGADFKFYFASLDEFHDYIQDNLLEPIFKRFIRFNTASVTYSIDYGTNYKQLYTGTGARGATMSSDNPYFIPYVLEKTKIIQDNINNIFDGGALPKIFGDEQTTFWDYLSDMIAQTMQNFWTVYTLMDTLLTSITLENRQLFLEDGYKSELYEKNIENLIITPNAEKVPQVEISIFDKAGKDYEKIVFPNKILLNNLGITMDNEPDDSRTGKKMQITLYHHNLPVIYDDLFINNLDSQKIKSIYQTSDYHSLVLLYKDIPLKQDTSKFFHGSDNRWIRCHEKCALMVGNNLSSDDFVQFILQMTKTNFLVGTIDTPLSDKELKCYWALNGQAMILAQTYYYVFNHVGQNKCMGNINMEYGYNVDTFASGYNIWFQSHFAMFNLTLLGNPAPYDVMFETLNAKYKITKVGAKLIAENYADCCTVEFEALSTYG